MGLHWKKIKESAERIGYRKILHKTFELPDGKLKEFTIKDEQYAVCIFALSKSNQVILAKQFRPGPEKVISELPGGAIDPGESPMECARRELLEETGHEGELHFIGTTLDCAYSTLVRYNFVAINCVQTAPQSLDESEFIEVELMTLDQFLKHLRKGQFSDVETAYKGLDYLGLFEFKSQS